ncbi:MAG: protein kinase [Deltaproteobacteria bacterium]|nr:MAG: protein kinase [Deltaproteobacteria bacterium]
MWESLSKIIEALPLEYLSEGFSEAVESGKEYLRGVGSGEGITLYLLLGILTLLFLWMFLRRRRVIKTSLRGVNRQQARQFFRKAKTLAKKGDFLRSGELFQSVGQLDAAVKMFLKADAHFKLAEVFVRQDRLEEAAQKYEEIEHYERAAFLYSQLNRYVEAAVNYRKARKYKLTAELYERANDFLKAGEYYHKVLFYRKAAEMYVRGRDFEQAGRMLEESVDEFTAMLPEDMPPEKCRGLKGMAATSGELYRKVEQIGRAARIWERGGLYSWAAECCCGLEDYSRASELYIKAGLPMKAAEVMERLGEEKKSALLKAKTYLEKGQKIEAAEYYEKAEDYLKAADLHKELGDSMKAGELYEKGGDPSQAAKIYVEAGEVKKAALAYKQANDYKAAAELFGQIGDGQEETDLLEKAEEFYFAGSKLRKKGLNDKAIKFLQRVERESPDYQNACNMLGDIFKEKGMWSLAIKKYQEAIRNEDITQTNVSSYYNLATVMEKGEDFDEALNIYERILALDYYYQDVASRIYNVKKKIETASESKITRDLYAQTSVGSTTDSALKDEKKTRYKMLEVIGHGGMGVVYKAKDLVLDRVVAYKVLPKGFSENPNAINFFQREAKATAALSHPNIVTVFDMDQDEKGDFYITMEFIEGSTLKEILGRQKILSIPAVVLIAGQVCKGLGYAHKKSIVHRDIKPGNVMWTQEKVVKIMDFGLAKVLKEVMKDQTIVGGTPYYMSPEQTLGEQVDHRADIYSLGVTIFEMAAGEVPFKEGDVGYHHVHSPIPSPRGINSQIPEELEKIILRCMAKKPEERYQNTEDVFNALKNVS